MTTRILTVVTNVDSYATTAEPTGLWLSELTHAWDEFSAHGFDQVLVSPAGGASPLEPRSLKFPGDDKSARAWRSDPMRMALLHSTHSPTGIDPGDFDAIYYTGGHGTMFDFPDNARLQEITREIFEQGGVVSSVCHGYCGLLNTRLSDGRLLIDGRRMTGFSWREEKLSGVDKAVPFNAEVEARSRGGLYERARFPFASYVVTAGRLITGQNPASARATARAVIEALSSPQFAGAV